MTLPCDYEEVDSSTCITKTSNDCAQSQWCEKSRKETSVEELVRAAAPRRRSTPEHTEHLVDGGLMLSDQCGGRQKTLS